MGKPGTFMDFEAALLDMIQNQIVARGVTSPRILEALQRVPRHLFVPEHLQAEAYEDHPIALPENRATISQPYMVAYMAYALNCESSHRILEIGTGSGYQAAVLSCLSKKVYSVERHQSLSLSAMRTIQFIGQSNVECKVGDGVLGWPDQKPFDRILVTAAARHVPKSLAEQLDNGGQMLFPIGDSQIQTLMRIIREGESYYSQPLIPCVFVPLVTKIGSLTDTSSYEWISTVDR